MKTPNRDVMIAALFFAMAFAFTFSFVIWLVSIVKLLSTP